MYVRKKETAPVETRAFSMLASAFELRLSDVQRDAQEFAHMAPGAVVQSLRHRYRWDVAMANTYAVWLLCVMPPHII